MPDFKVEWLMDFASVPPAGSDKPARSGGFSEGCFFNGTLATARARLNLLCGARARLLPTTASIIGQRIREVGGAVQTGGAVFAGNPSYPCDIPQMAVNLKMFARITNNTRKFQVRCIPDQFTAGGEYAPDATYRSLLLEYVKALHRLDFRFSCQQKDAWSASVVYITTGGLLTMDNSVGDHTGSYVDLLRCRDTIGRTVKGKFLLTDKPSTYTYQLGGWGGEVVSDSGRVRLVSKSYELFGNPLVPATAVNVGRLGTHKVGRSFFAYIGRVSNRR